ncbi:hypothetical protein Tdes44962_MAKER08418 [Teratosphaeria destructans]|uniref:Uncharacterized protein n=1 Tax=Teratosphaeria destructans TaxID=418781 RepID=A0A9W7SWB5_9PEZI|nr:hypothetical protein Tdes44962_MAKER08418 [Teratosphaeria destructans]
MEVITTGPSSVLAREQVPECPQGFLGLPVEIRDQIFELVVVRQQTTITMLSNYDCHRSEVSACQPAISMVNHQLRAETLPIFYSMNLFLAEVSDRTDLMTAKRWLEAIGDGNIRCLRRLALCGWTRVPFGHMVSKRWVKIVLDVKEGRMEVEGPSLEPGIHYHVNTAIDELKDSFKNMVEASENRRLDGKSVASLMAGFNSLCTIY